MIILFMACCDAPLPNGISHIEMKDNVVYIDNLVCQSSRFLGGEMDKIDCSFV